MSLTISTQITGQVASSTLSYSFLQEPLKVHITDSDSTVSIIYADITRINTETGVQDGFDSKYIYRDVSSLGGVIVDLSKVMRQMHDYDVYKFGSVSDIISGWDSVISKYIYKFEFYTNKSTAKTTILKLPIIGGRSFETFTPAVTYLTSLQDLSLADLQNTKLGGYSTPTYTLKQISSVVDDNYIPTKTENTITATSTNVPCGGVIHWKSKLGGWMSWGMDLKTETKSHGYQGQLNVGMFESTSWSGGGNPFIGADYTQVSSGLTLNLKSLAVPASELEGLSEIAGSPAVYFQKSPTSKLELMRMDSYSAPIKTHIGGGDFTVSLSRISSTENKTK